MSTQRQRLVSRPAKRLFHHFRQSGREQRLAPPATSDEGGPDGGFGALRGCLQYGPRSPRPRPLGEDLRPKRRRNFSPKWPPDVFAMVATVLQKSGAYSEVVNGQWPPRGTGDQWARRMSQVGGQWRRQPRRTIQWETWMLRASVPIHRGGRVLCHAHEAQDSAQAPHLAG